jgi:hypothetical protein
MPSTVAGAGWEIDKTIELSKRLLPLIFKPVPDADIPTKVKGRNCRLLTCRA